MVLLLKQSTSVVVSFGPFVSQTDGVTLKTVLVSALDHASTGIFLSKNGGTLTIRHASVTASTYDAYGMYKVTLDTTDTNTLGTLRMAFADATTNLPVWQDFLVVAANIWDSLVGGTDILDVSVTQLLGTAWLTPGTAGTPDVNAKLWNGLATVDLPLAPTTAGRKLDVSTGGEAGLDWANVGSPTTTVGLSGTTIASSQAVASVSGAVGSVTGSVGSVTGAVGSVTGNVGGNVTGSVGSVVGAVGSVTGITSADVGAIKAKTDNLPATPAAVADIPTATQNADALLNRDMSAVSDTNDRSPLNALRFLRNAWSILSGTLTVTKEDDSTTAWTSTLDTDAAADPVIGSDPA